MTQEAGNPKALRAHKAESAKETRQELELAIRRIVNGNPKRVKKGTPLSPAAVAAEAGIDRTTLYRYHEPVLTEIRRITEGTPQKKLREKQSELADAVTRAKEYRLMLEEEQASLVKMARENYALKARVKELAGKLRDCEARIADLRTGSGAGSKEVTSIATARRRGG